jgi:signal transduction histidine kinase
VLVAIGGLFSLYSIRLRRVAAQLNVRFEERLAERTRIAQELHDTLLQGSISASMQLHVLSGQVVDHSIKSKLDHILLRFREMIDEGRQTVQALRTSPGIADRLEHALSRDGRDLAAGLGVDVRVTVHGHSRPLHPLVRDDCYRIGREALANALRHARASSIRIEVAYYADRLRLWVSDDGRGMERSVLESGRPGHWGMLGMRERAKHIGATITVRSEPGVGTEVELSVPGSLAFDQSQMRSSPIDSPEEPVRLTAVQRLSGWFQRSRRRPVSRGTV